MRLRSEPAHEGELGNQINKQSDQESDESGYQFRCFVLLFFIAGAATISLRPAIKSSLQFNATKIEAVLIDRARRMLPLYILGICVPLFDSGETKLIMTS